MSELPIGTVTFLFTDIEGSTRLWEDHHEAMRGALARHDAILRAAVERNRGAVVKTTGDGVHAVFATADAALATAVDAQQVLTEEAWGATGPLRVRMGVHTGAAQLRDGDYYGSTLNRAARIMSIAHGGQILLSNATEELVRDALSGIELVDLGGHELPGMARPERIFQVVHPELTADFPPLMTATAYAAQLPHQRTMFVGRELELAAVRSLIDRSQIVTLVGPGGVGKTRLALQVASDAVHLFPDGARFIDLAPVLDAEFVAATVAASLQVPEGRHRSIEEGIVAVLKRRQALLVLDNCEQVIQEAARIVDLIVSRCPSVTVLATSREALGIEGEDAFSVAPMGLPDRGADTAELLASDAIRLLAERARASRPELMLDDRTAGVAAELCRRLDGIPLAIELAAARLQAMTPSDLLERLDQRLGVLTKGRRGGLDRHQTLEAAIDWSFGLLEPVEQHAFARLSVFVGGCTVEAAEAVIAGEPVETADVVEILAGLVAKSMLVLDDSGAVTRYRLLETVREYAAARLGDDGGTAAVHDRHLAFYAQLAIAARAHLEGSDDQEWLERLGADEDNIRAALARARDAGDAELLLGMTSAIGRFWLQNGKRRDGLTWTQAALEIAPDDPTPLRADALAWAGAHADDLGRYDLGAPLLEESVTCSAAVGVPPQPMALSMLALFEMESHRPEVAVQRSEEALAAAQERGSEFEQTEQLARLALVTALAGDEARSISVGDEAVERARRLGNGYVMTAALQGAAHARLGCDPAAAVEYFEEAERVPTSTGQGWSTMSQVRFFKGIARLRLGDFAEGVRDVVDALDQFEQMGNRYYLSIALGLAATLVARRDPWRAVTLLAAAERGREDLGLAGAPQDLAAQERVRVRAAQVLPSGEYERAWRAGRGLDDETAVRVARGALDEAVSLRP